MILLHFIPEILVITLIFHIALTYSFVQGITRNPKFLAVVSALYLGSYFVLSANGSYVLANHGGSHWTKSWCPAFVIVEYGFIRTHIRPTLLAAFYAPLVIIDRSIVHPNLEPWDGYYE